MALCNFETLHVIFLTRKRRYKFLAPLELAPWCNTGNPYGAIGDLALYVYLTKVFHFQFQFQFQVHVIVRDLVLVLVLVLVFASVLVRILVRVRVKLNMALWMFLSDMAIILSIPKGPTRWRRSLKGLSHESIWVKSAEKSRRLSF
jgi:hypothetical protein